MFPHSLNKASLKIKSEEEKAEELLHWSVPNKRKNGKWYQKEHMKLNSELLQTIYKRNYMTIYRIISSKVNSNAYTALKYKVAIPGGFPFLLTF